MSHSVKRSKSKNEQFRMAVPRDIRHLVGKSEWTASLGTTDPVAAAAMRGELVARHKKETLRLRGQLAHKPVADALALLDRGFERLAIIRGSMDKAIAEQLALLASTVIDSWLPADQLGQPQSWGGMTVWEAAGDAEPVPSIDTEPEREIFRVRAALLEGTGKTDGILYRRLAALLLERRVFHPIRFAVSYMASIEPKLKLDRDDVYEAVASAYLDRLAGHHFTSWPARAEAAVEAILSIPGATAPAHVAMPPQTVATGLWAMPLSKGLEVWIKARTPSASAVTEATRSVSRFITLLGDMTLADITRPHVTEFRDLIADMPPRSTPAKLAAAGLTLRAAIEAYRDVRQAWKDSGGSDAEPEQLAPGTVKKDVGALSQILSVIVEESGTGVNVAEGILIHGYSKKKSRQKKPRLSLTSAMMQKLFDSPLFTGCAGRTPAKRHRAGRYIFQDELYWAFLFGVMSGPRLREIGQIALSDVHSSDMRRTYGDEYEGHCTFVHITGTGAGQSTKTETSERFVVIHDRLIELGFDDYVARRRAAGKTTLFDFNGRSAASFVKTLSNRLNRYIDEAVTDDERYVFHSMRHEFTDRAELSEIPARIANSIKGHATVGVADSYGSVSILAQYEALKKLKVNFIDWERLLRAKASAPAE
jgi:integrase